MKHRMSLALAADPGFFYGNADTDGGRPIGTHHDWVAREIYKVNPKLERIDYQISSNYETINHLYPINNALSSLRSLHDAGEKIGAYNMSWTVSAHYSTKALINASLIEVSSVSRRPVMGEFHAFKT